MQNKNSQKEKGSLLKMSSTAGNGCEGNTSIPLPPLKASRKQKLLFFKSMKLAKAIECGGEEMSGRNQYVWEPKAVNN